MEMSISFIHNTSNSNSSISLSSFSSSSSSSYLSLQPQYNHFLSYYPKPTNIYLPRVPPRRSVLCLARRRNNSSRPLSSTSKKNKSHKKANLNKEDDLDEDAFEALFKQLEEDLKQDESLLDDLEDEISEEELAMLERELEEALAEDDTLSELLNLTTNIAEAREEGKEGMGDEAAEEDAADEEQEDEEEEEPVKLKGWQLKRLAYALKVGRRKTNIKSLAAELCLDRSVVLELLRDPPPNLLMLSATLPDKPEPPVAIPDSRETSSFPSEVEVIADTSQPEPKVETPIHVLQNSWSAQKRLKKAQVETLENVYRRTKRPTNAMISSIVHVTNLPRRRVVKWFEDKRADEGVPEEHRPYRRKSSESVFTQ
ncbi:protein OVEREXPRESSOR OF CATIONIC PEROXIDASE 3 [Amaranthus tricolor]|uniref:protein OVEREXPRESSOR OF CATIONIC PEROXIDASE 3 n=1 Tax=Amaranthus tricolor TaxID=29722 RepID=UPI00258625A5|nr:protein OVEREXPRESSOR OF CATIONIC PEROXIDASE 3 [Amaranthus tricolor]